MASRLSTYITIIRSVSLDYMFYGSASAKEFWNGMDLKNLPNIWYHIRGFSSVHTQPSCADRRVSSSLLANRNLFFGSTDQILVRKSRTLFACQLTSSSSRVRPWMPPPDIQLFIMTLGSEGLQRRSHLLSCVVFQPSSFKLRKQVIATIKLEMGA